MWDYVQIEQVKTVSHSITPLIPAAWESALHGYSDSPRLVNWVRSGVSLGVTQEGRLKSAKMTLKAGVVLRNKLMTEVHLHRVLGPFKSPPLNNLHTSPLSVVPKKTPGKYRLIHNLSAPRGHSVNEAIPAHQKTVSYCRVADAVDHVLSVHPSQVLLTKFDLRDAYRVIPVRRQDWHYLGMAVKGAFFVDTVLPMGCATSCSIFQAFTNAICWIMKRRFSSLKVFGYLDDFLLISTDLRVAEIHAAGFERLCAELGLPIAEDKTVGPVRHLTFLGIGLDVEHNQLYLDRTRTVQSTNKIQAFLGRRKWSRKKWQSLVGTLSFLSQVVRPGKSFMSRICKKLCGARYLIRMDPSTRDDLNCWV